MPRPASLWLLRLAPMVLAAMLLSAVVAPELAAQQYKVTGVIRDARSDSALAEVSIQTEWDDIIGIPHPPVTSDGAGRFELRLDRLGPLVLSLRKLGYQQQRLTVNMTSDSTAILVRLVRSAQALPTVTVTETAVQLFVDSMRIEMRAVDHMRFYDTAALAKSTQALAGGFLFGPAGMKPTPCRRSALFLPKGTMRSVPVENEPADYWVPCVLARGNPRSVMVRIDGGDPQPFASISHRELAEFAAIAIVSDRLVIAFTKSYAATHAPR